MAMNNQAGIKAALPFIVVFFILPLIMNTLFGYTWNANLADTFKISRVITGFFMSIGCGLYIAKKQKY
jgi:hypothetical protein